MRLVEARAQALSPTDYVFFITQYSLNRYPPGSSSPDHVSKFHSARSRSIITRYESPRKGSYYVTGGRV